MIKAFKNKYSQTIFETEKLKDVPQQFRHIAKRVWRKLDILDAAPNPKICEEILGKKNYKPLKGNRKATTLSRAIHPGEILKKELLTPQGISQAELARSINVSVRRVNDICQGKRGITPDTALRLALYFNLGNEGLVKRKPSGNKSILCLARKEFLKPAQITQSKLATDIKVSFRRINDICQGKRPITVDTAEANQKILQQEIKPLKLTNSAGLRRAQAGEALELLTNLENNSVSLVFLDPQYEPVKKVLSVNYPLYSQSDYQILRILEQIERILKPKENVLPTKKRKHPHQKPRELIKALISATTNEGDLIIDPCAGSFVVLEACQELRREFLEAEQSGIAECYRYISTFCQNCGQCNSCQQRTQLNPYSTADLLIEVINRADYEALIN
ncbi:6802_t:CDS:2 [Funneliformis geosporum]|uniref:6802_t:CDS:1 n=1 Tax=Funneliformis geosporum TaxID=1117311 RepID=A0A9W4WHQ2_9GLOM|nr:6802_t:CDS:2 [Funneliformis geosporum]